MPLRPSTERAYHGAARVSTPAASVVQAFDPRQLDWIARKVNNASDRGGPSRRSAVDFPGRTTPAGNATGTSPVCPPRPGNEAGGSRRPRSGASRTTARDEPRLPGGRPVGHRVGPRPRGVHEGQAPPDAHAEVERHPRDLRPPLLPGERDDPTRPGVAQPLAERQVRPPAGLVCPPAGDIHGNITR